MLVHGGTGSWSHWRRVIPELSDQYRLLMPDLPGFGASNLPPRTADVRSLVDTLRASLDVLMPETSRLNVVGFSFGGLVAGLLTEGIGERLGRLVLVGTSGLGLPGSRRLPLRRWRSLPPEDQASVYRHNLATLMISDTSTLDAETLEIHAANAAAARFDSRAISAQPYLIDSLHRTPRPLGLIWGEKDAIAANDMADRIALLRQVDPDCPITVIPGAGHWVAHERPTAFAAALRSMIAA
ncbi:alpha/beta hydrolase [uncultured Jannaschia sp.]|uniref:alpha/beta fold hydrolase n=1 Tax=uncultured Jannaschia sp. TaxID=293347 RepID=UPI002604E8EE|nr:alpha/beta hydrolase [uncultured Jannaschia sp.]